jgi:hypothetical protein
VPAEQTERAEASGKQRESGGREQCIRVRGRAPTDADVPPRRQPPLGIYIEHDHENEKRTGLNRWSEQLAVIVQTTARVVPLRARKGGDA